jgi:hypothetical protein
MINLIQYLLVNADIAFILMLLIPITAGFVFGMRWYADFIGTELTLKKQMRCRHRWKTIVVCEDCGIRKADE